LLKDIFSCTTTRKVIFVGDNCQLPPIEKNAVSAALDENYIKEKLFKRVHSYELNHIMRQANENEIIQLSAKYKHAIKKKEFEKYPKIELLSRKNIFSIQNDNKFIELYAQKYQQYGNKKLIMISHSHSIVTAVNHIIRRHLGLPPTLTVGDILLIVQNNPISGLTNGDLVEVLSIHGQENDYENKFLRVTVRNTANGEEHTQLILPELLYNNKANLDATDNQKLLIDFDKRMSIRKYKRNSEQYKDALRTDMYANALRAKFGYAITCHKAQGGEWPYVFLFMEGKTYGLKGEALYRWLYTAVTRASEHLVVNHNWWVKP
jgi:ATP-dependent exoDNAse (exonuclease V) alpha subunit